MAKKTQLIVPTAINVLMFVNDSFITSRRAGDDMTLSLPGIRKRAKLIVNSEGALQVTVSTEASTTTYIR